MFAKLLKHEWKASSGFLGILSLAALGVGVLGAIVLRILSSLEVTEDVDAVLMAVLIIAMCFLVLALMAYATGSGLLLLFRFYKSKFTDQGYLTFTLPVTSRQIFLASFLNIGIWSTITSLVVAASLLLMFLLGINWQDLVDPGMLEEIRYSYKLAFENNSAALEFLTGLTGSVSGIIVMMTCVTVGAVVARKHKILAAFGIYYGYTVVSGIIQTIVTVLQVLMLSEGNTGLFILPTVIFHLLIAAGGFFLSTYLMEKKLNLP